MNCLNDNYTYNQKDFPLFVSASSGSLRTTLLWGKGFYFIGLLIFHFSFNFLSFKGCFKKSL